MQGEDAAIRRSEAGGRGRFSFDAGAGEAELTYALRGGVMVIDHTFTPPAMRGHGAASRLMAAAAAHAREAGLKILPLCSYADCLDATARRRARPAGALTA